MRVDTLEDKLGRAWTQLGRSIMPQSRFVSVPSGPIPTGLGHHGTWTRSKGVLICARPSVSQSQRVLVPCGTPTLWL